MPEIGVNIELYCICGNGLCNNATAGHTRGRGEAFFEIEPCEKCLEKAKEEGKEEAEKEMQNDN